MDQTYVFTPMCQSTTDSALLTLVTLSLRRCQVYVVSIPFITDLYLLDELVHYAQARKARYTYS